jgi:hypothetical protein
MKIAAKLGLAGLAAGIFGLTWIASTVPATANCICQCVDGKMQPLCNTHLAVPPICPPTICPIMTPSIAPINPPTIPPIGSTLCRQARGCDSFGNCEWRQLCQ